jgi:hypothetical protein
MRRTFVIHIERLTMPVLAELAFMLEEAKEGNWWRIVLLNVSDHRNRCQCDSILAQRCVSRDPYSTTTRQWDRSAEAVLHRERRTNFERPSQYLPDSYRIPCKTRSNARWPFTSAVASLGHLLFLRVEVREEGRSSGSLPPRSTRYAGLYLTSHDAVTLKRGALQ